MTTYTKITKITTELHGMTYPGIIDAYNDKLEQLIFEGKTDGDPSSPGPNVFVRYWVDEAAAQEWLDFVNATLTSFGVAWTSAEVLDNPDL